MRCMFKFTFMALSKCKRYKNGSGCAGLTKSGVQYARAQSRAVTPPALIDGGGEVCSTSVPTYTRVY